MCRRLLCRRLTVFLVVWMRFQKGLAKSDSSSIKYVIDNMLDNGGYDATIRPFYDVGDPVRVEVDVVLNTLGPVVEREMQMSASFYLRQQWKDPRMSFQGVNRSISLNHRRADDIWLPDMYFSQSKNEYLHDITTPNILIRLHPDGTILYSQRLSVTFQCLMDLRKFPLDKQMCYIRMESYSHTTDDMFFAWSSERKSMDILENAHIPDFELTEITTHDCTATYATGTYPCLEARLMLQRQIGFYMTQTYIPSILIVTLSWVSFWLDPQAVPARVSVGLLTVLTITTQSTGVRSQLPRVPYTKSIDVWMSVCLVFVFAAYMQYALVTIFSRRQRKAAPPSPPPSSDTNTKCSDNTSSASDSFATHSDVTVSTFSKPNGESLLEHNSTKGEVSIGLKIPASASDSGQRMRMNTEQRDHGHLVDKWSRVLFPLGFALFNLSYWAYYTLSDQSGKL